MSTQFLPVVYLWDNATSHAIEKGHLRLQRGQWCQAGGNKGRYVGTTPSGSVWVVYKPIRSSSMTLQDKFKVACANFDARFKKVEAA